MKSSHDNQTSYFLCYIDGVQWMNIQEFVVLFKAGDRKQCSNYRTIALISHTSKILLLIIVNRLKRKLEFEQPEEQAAYRKGRGTRDMLVCLQVLIEKIIAIDGKVFIMFIDYSKTFDSVSHCKLFEAFLEMGFPKHLVTLLKSLYVNQRAIIRWVWDWSRSKARVHNISTPLCYLHWERNAQCRGLKIWSQNWGTTHFKLTLCRWHCANSKLRRGNFTAYQQCEWSRKGNKLETECQENKVTSGRSWSRWSTQHQDWWRDSWTSRSFQISWVYKIQ